MHMEPRTWQSSESKHPASWIVSVRVCQEEFISNRKLIIVVSVVNVISNLHIVFCTSNHSSDGIKTTEHNIKTQTSTLEGCMGTGTRYYRGNRGYTAVMGTKLA